MAHGDMVMNRLVRRGHMKRRVGAICGTCALGLFMGSPAVAQTIIDMPLPPAQRPPADVDQALVLDHAGATATAASAVVVTASSSSAASPSVGDVALARYAGARSGTRNTYFNDGSFFNNGIRVYTFPKYYPQFVWGPFWGGWPWRCW